jgi:hypothetical protein
MALFHCCDRFVNRLNLCWIILHFQIGARAILAKTAHLRAHFILRRSGTLSIPLYTDR